MFYILKKINIKSTKKSFFRLKLFYKVHNELLICFCCVFKCNCLVTKRYFFNIELEFFFNVKDLIDGSNNLCLEIPFYYNVSLFIGRPFVAALINPRMTNLNRDQMNTLQREINSSTDLVGVRDLQVTDKCVISINLLFFIWIIDKSKSFTLKFKKTSYFYKLISFFSKVKTLLSLKYFFIDNTNYNMFFFFLGK